MYGFPQVVRIAHNALVKHLDPYGYHPLIKYPGLSLHDIQIITFTSVVDNFWVKYSGKEHVLHLKTALGDKYKVATYWEGKLYTGITLKWDHEKGTVTLSIPGCVYVSLHYFQYKEPKRLQDSPYPWTQPIYVKKIRCYHRKYQL